ncbi:uncharacterized protein F5Z01DRAFT_670006 [Emericellopsis atlantica]|uniref:PH domain-containing protein n=1 Tax=Emericellopsis atlantica TaxID=2614577 RepID=A0A9P8CUW1_9HYPO|nr:uncharacterized protein F5Z01DRAFT_670006 [Emericellopsis atlantica]KAG9259290.1 hypothetical protein F5Z01DRAFT_670006 [Emericellopsis atlantica]
MPRAPEPDHIDTIRWRPGQQPIDLPITEEKTTTDTVSPSRNEKLARRESRLGLRSIFGRNKPARHLDTPVTQHVSKQPGQPSSPSGTTTQGIPYYSLPPGRPIVKGQVSRPLSVTAEDAESLPPLSADADETPKPKAPVGKSGKAGSQSWQVPPFHKACPEAAQHSNLPAPTVPADLILRSHERKAAEAALEVNNEQAADKAKGRKKPRRNRAGTISDAEWTKKTYILLESGHLLEYAQEGPFDRMPEKVLRLNRSSAAFASDLIPGRHWVLQVSSIMGAEGATMTDANRGLFSRLPFRGGHDKRHAANMLLVFESADDMDSWLVNLRSVIELLGGKKTLTETGAPKSEPTTPLREQTSQRTLLVREHDRHSRSIPEDQTWEQDCAWRESSDTSAVPSLTPRDRSLDGMSATNSVVSQDGHQLDSLRSSANRLSCVSSGQRTMVTSADSSPACSPTTENFPSPVEEPTRRHPEVSNSDSRLRPNATAIVDRRKSLQTMTPFVVEPQPTSAQSQRPQSSLIGSTSPGFAGHVVAPNFSVPHSSNRRFSTARLPTVEASSHMQPSPVIFEQAESPAPSRTALRKSPGAIRTSRPLSMVLDQPTPRCDQPGRPATRHGDSLKAGEATEETLPLPTRRSGAEMVDLHSPTLGALDPVRAASPTLPQQTTLRTSPRRLSSMGALRAHSDPTDRMRLRPLGSSPKRTSDTDRCHSTIVTYERAKTFAHIPGRLSKRASMVSTPSSFPHSPPSAPPPSMPLPQIPQSGSRLKADTSAHALFNRRSMPQLSEGPPPMPPPTCALPPIPQKVLQGHAVQNNHTDHMSTIVDNEDDKSNFF